MDSIFGAQSTSRESLEYNLRPLLDEKLDDESCSGPSLRRQSGLLAFWNIKILSIVLAISLIGNLASILRAVRPRGSTCHERSIYGRDTLLSAPKGVILTYHVADLATDYNVPFQWATDYATDNLTLAAELWDGINFDVGFVALRYEWTEEKDLPRAQPFPWDHEQGLYVLNGYHALHCLKNIHRSLRQYHLGQPQTLPLMHITHCLDSLRGDVICQADDTPRYTTITKSPESAIGQIRQCRDWKKLEEWARDRTSCYNYISSEADHINQFERFKFCPPNSPYWPKVREHFGKGPDWKPVSDSDIITQ